MKVTNLLKLSVILIMGISTLSCSESDDAISVSEYSHEAKFTGKIDITQEEIEADLKDLSGLLAAFTTADESFSDNSLAKKLQTEESREDIIQDIDKEGITEYGDTISITGVLKVYDQDMTNTKMTAKATTDVTIESPLYVGTYATYMSIKGTNSNDVITTSVDYTFDVELEYTNGFNFEFVNARANISMKQTESSISASGEYVYPFYANNGLYHGEFRGEVDENNPNPAIESDVFYKNNKIGTLRYAKGETIIIKDLDGNIVE